MKIICPHCNYSRDVNPDSIPPKARRVICPRCHQKFGINPEELAYAAEAPVHEQTKPVSTEAKETAAQRPRAGKVYASLNTQMKRNIDEIPWENQTRGYFKGFLQTVNMVLFHPGEFFSRMPVRGGKATPLLFGVLAGAIGFCFSLFWPLLANDLRGWSRYLDPFSMNQAAGLLLVVAVLSPVIIAVGLFLYALFTHFLLILVRGNKNGFEATFRVISYSYAGNLFSVVPILGGIVGGIWTVVLEIIGLSRAHGIGILRVVFAVIFLPFIIIMLLAAALISSLGLFAWFLLN